MPKHPSDPLRDATTRQRIQKMYALRDSLRAWNAWFLVVFFIALTFSLVIYLPLAAVVMFIGMLGAIAGPVLTILPYVQFTLRGLFLNFVAPQRAFVLLTSKHNSLELLGCVVLSIWITALVYFLGKINAAIDRYDDERKFPPRRPPENTPINP